MKPGTIENLRARTVCVLSHRYRFIYLTTAKNATTSLKAELTSEPCAGEVLVRARVASELWERYFTFAFLRDPVTRLLSAYHEVSLRMERGELECRPFGSMPDGFHRFGAFLDDLDRSGPWNEHIAPQAAFVEGRRIDFWGRVETIQADLEEIYRRLGIGPCPILPKLRPRQGRGEREGIRRYIVREEDLDASIIERIRDLYREDTELIASVRPDARVSHSSPPGRVGQIGCGPTRELVGVAVALTDGSEYAFELPADHPALADLLAIHAPRETQRGVPRPHILQVPLDVGNAALTFSPRHLVRLDVRHTRAPNGQKPEVTPPEEAVEKCRNTLRQAQGERKKSFRNQIPTAQAELIEASFRRKSTASEEGGNQKRAERAAHPMPAGEGHDPLTNVDEAHLGGYTRAAPTPTRRSVSTSHGDPFTWNPLLWQWLIEELEVRSVLDVGCGEGHAAGFFRDGGCDVLGVDGSLQARGDSVIHKLHAVHDFVDGPFIPNRRFDLVWSCEFVEHVEERYLHNFLSTFASSRKYVLMTYAHPGQPGWHHVNCRKEAYWVEKLGRMGFDLDRTLTHQARELGSDHFRNRGLVLVRRDTRAAASFVPDAADGRSGSTVRADPLPVHSMPVAQLKRDTFYLFHDIFVHATRPKVVAVCSYYGEDWTPAEHDVDYDAVDLVVGDHRIRGRCLRHRLDSWEPCMLLEFEAPKLDALIRKHDEISFAIEVGKHSQRFTVSTRPVPAVDVAMSLVVRNENRWIRSFLEYYLYCLKAQHVFIYDNGTEDREALLSVLEPYRQRGEVTYIPWDLRWRNRVDGKMIGQPAQEAHSLARFANCRWLGFFDVDEFLRLPHTTLPAFLNRFAGVCVDGLSFGIRWFSYRGPLGLDEVENPPLTYLYSRPDRLGRKRQKFFVKGGETRFLRLHWLEDGKCELPIDDAEMYFHHYEQHPGRFEQGKDAAADYDDYMLRFRDRLSLPETRRPPLTEREWIEHIVSAFDAAEGCRSELTDDVLAVDGFCGRYTRHFYNNLCRFAGCRYLEIGSYHGASTCAALYANEVSAVCIDNWSQFRGRRSRFEDAVQRFRGRSTVEVIEKNCFEIDPLELGPFDVFLYDGDHSLQSQYRAMERFVPTLAEYAVIVIDDWNRPPVQQGTRDAIRDLGLEIVFDQEIPLTPEDTADKNPEAGQQTWWNGMYVMLIRRR